MSLYASENDDITDKFVEDAKDSYFVKWVTDHIKAGRPIMVEWGDWDGYYYYPLERWFYMWKDRNVAPKPYQIQPYIVIDVAE